MDTYDANDRKIIRSLANAVKEQGSGLAGNIFGDILKLAETIREAGAPERVQENQIAELNEVVKKAFEKLRTQQPKEPRL